MAAARVCSTDTSGVAASVSGRGSTAAVAELTQLLSLCCGICWDQCGAVLCKLNASSLSDRLLNGVWSSKTGLVLLVIESLLRCLYT